MSLISSARKLSLLVVFLRIKDNLKFRAPEERKHTALLKYRDLTRSFCISVLCVQIWTNARSQTLAQLTPNVKTRKAHSNVIVRKDSRRMLTARARVSIV